MSSLFDLGALRAHLLGGPRSAGPESGRPDSGARETRGEGNGIRMSLSAEGLERSRADGDGSARPVEEESEASKPAEAGFTGTELTDEEQREVDELARRDREVRAHEAAHKAAAGGLAKGGASFSYESGPDGRRYAVGGEVSIDASPVEGDPAATARKMERVRAAALAPANPSGQDRQVASTAANQARQARVAAAREATELGETVLGETSDSGEATEAGSCPVCAGAGHGPGQHRGEVDFRA